MESQRVAVPGLGQLADFVGVLLFDHFDKPFQTGTGFVFGQVMRYANAELGHGMARWKLNVRRESPNSIPTTVSLRVGRTRRGPRWYRPRHGLKRLDRRNQKIENPEQGRGQRREKTSMTRLTRCRAHRNRGDRTRATGAGLREHELPGLRVFLPCQESPSWP